MRRHVGLIVLCVLLIGLTLKNVRVQPQDQGWLLNVYESTLDVNGFAADQWVQLQRLFIHCPALKIQDEHTTSALLKTIKEYSPPDSMSARFLWLGVTQDWAVAEVEFDKLSPAVIVLRQQRNGWQIPDTGIWSGTTHPWRASPLIREFLGSRNPDVPSQLLRCWQAHGMF